MSKDGTRFATLLGQIADDFTSRRARGETPDIAEYAQRFPQAASLLRDILPMLEAMPAAGTNSAASNSGETLGKGERVDKATGQVGCFEILGELGRGGMGVVHKARQPGLNRLVALKRIRTVDRPAPEALSRFLAEAALVAQLQHPGIVQIFEYGEHDGVPYFALEFVEGGTLAQRLAGEPQPPRDAARLVENLALAVAHAHEQGVVHRDLRPANVLLTKAGVPKITDFGLAKQLHCGPQHTQTGAILGTPSYMAPEQASGDSQAVDPAADVYALGAILYECLTGRPPFKGATILETLEQVREAEPVRPRDLAPATPRDLEVICLTCLHKNPARRYASAGCLVDDLHAFLDGRPIQARPVGRLERAAKWVRRNRALASVMAVSVVAVLALLVGAFWAQAERQSAELRSRDQARAEALVTALGRVEPAALARVLTDLEEHRTQARPLLNAMLAAAPADSRDEMRARLGLLTDDDAHLAALSRYLLDAPADEVLAVGKILAQHGPAVAALLWPELSNSQADGGRRLRAAAILAAVMPVDDPRWQTVAEPIVSEVTRGDAFAAGRWAEGLAPVRTVLAPLLRQQYREGQRKLAAPGLTRPEVTELAARIDLTAALAVRLSDALPDHLAGLAIELDSRHFPALRPQLTNHREPILEALRGELRRIASNTANYGERDELAAAQANAAVALLQLGGAAEVWPLLNHSVDPSRRSYLIEQLAARASEPAVLIERLRTTTSTSEKRALLLALGDFDERRLPEPRRTALAPVLLRWYQDDPDSGIHGAVDWLLRQRWGWNKQLQAIDAELAQANQGKIPDPGQRGWFVNGVGQTYAVVSAPVEFWMGAPSDEPGTRGLDLRHRRRIDRGFALATRPITVRDWERFTAEQPKFRYEIPKGLLPDLDCPMSGMTWFAAAAYCRWLSELERLPEEEMVYPEISKIGPGMKLPAGYLRRNGYRLPSEAELEYLCRAGAETARPYGSSESMLDRYAWYTANSLNHTHPVGLKRPNDFGMFDMLGNVWNWTQNPGLRYPAWKPGEVLEDEEVLTAYDESHTMELRGGAFTNVPAHLRCAERLSNPRPTNRSFDTGFRPARTMR